MTPKFRGIALGAACVITLVIAGALIHQLRSSAATAAATARELTKLKREVGDLAQSGGSPRLVLQVPQQGAVGATPAAASTLPTTAAAEGAKMEEEPADPDERRFRLQALQQATSELVSGVLDSETIDVPWARTAVERITTFYQGEEFANVRLNAECRSTLCKITVHSLDATRSETAFRRIVSKAPWPTTGIATFDRESQQGTVYLAREGSSLPEVDAETLAL
jgi:hypothetical protein